MKYSVMVKRPVWQFLLSRRGHFRKGLFLAFLTLFLAACSTSPPQPSDESRYQPAQNASVELLHTQDRLTLFSQWWLPASTQPPKAAVLLVHGTFVHSGFYAQWANYLSQHGYVVYGLDLRGWGQSQGAGRRGYVSHFNQYGDDLLLAYQTLRQRYPGIPLFLQGESLGGLVALYAQEQGLFPVDGMVLNAPAVQPALSLGFLRTPQWMAEFELFTASIPGKFMPDQPTLVPGSVVEMFAGLAVKNEALVSDFKNDPYVVHTALPFGFISALREGVNSVQDGMSQVTAPALIVQGTEDTLVPLSSSQFTLDQLASGDKTLRQYPGMTHATLHDDGHEVIWQDILAWLDAHVARHPH